ncbi:hypothetical protein CHU98_g5927 [Xylaria longipes]|nr:hypothetical protein CHU98_g5927 [Xylaria longipes]
MSLANSPYQAIVNAVSKSPASKSFRICRFSDLDYILLCLKLLLKMTWTSSFLGVNDEVSETSLWDVAFETVLQFLSQAHSYYKQQTISESHSEPHPIFSSLTYERYQERKLKSAIQSSKLVVDQPILAIEQYETAIFILYALVQNERLQLAAWTNGVDTRNTYENALKYRHDSTCDCVLQLEEMKIWRSKESAVVKLFWVHGPPGFETIARSKRVSHPIYGSWKVWSPVMRLKLKEEWNLDTDDKEDGSEAGAHSEDASKEDCTVSSSSLEMVKILMEAGADVCAVKDDGITALHYAAFRGEVNIVNELLDSGAFIDA